MAREQPTIAFLGPKTSYTSQVARKVFPDSDFLHMPKHTIEEVFASVQAGAVDRGVVPFENSSNGPVVETLELLADSDDRFGDVSVSGTANLRVDHCLLGFPSMNNPLTPPSTPPGPDASLPISLEWPTSQDNFDHIKRIYSHPQAFGQCQAFLSKYLPHAVRHEVSSTAAAAVAAMQDPHRVSAALASAVTIKDPRFPLSILAEKVQDAVDNETRFLVLKRVAPLRYRSPPAMWACQLFQESAGDSRGMLISCTCKLPSGNQLAAVLNLFQAHGLDARLVAVRPSRKQAWQNHYYIDIAARSKGDLEPRSQKETLGLIELGAMVQAWKFHGAWGSSTGW